MLAALALVVFGASTATQLKSLEPFLDCFGTGSNQCVGSGRRIMKQSGFRAGMLEASVLLGFIVCAVWQFRK